MHTIVMARTRKSGRTHALSNKHTDTEQPLWRLCQAHRNMDWS